MVKKIICEDCGLEYKRKDAVEEVNGMFFCKDCYCGNKRKQIEA